MLEIRLRVLTLLPFTINKVFWFFLSGGKGREILEYIYYFEIVSAKRDYHLIQVDLGSNQSLESIELLEYFD